MFTPDKFQIDAVNDVKKGINVLVVAPTGSGKHTLPKNQLIITYQNIKIFFTQHP